MGIIAFSNKIKKYVAVVLLAGFLIIQFGSVSVRPRNVEAQWVVWDPHVWQQNLLATIEEQWKEWMLQFIKQVLLKKIVNALQKNPPTFVKNWSDWLKKNGIDVGLDWITDNFGINLCGYFRPQLIASLKKYAKEPNPAPDCTLTQFLDNVSDHYDYLASGDWAVFEESLADENSEVGVYLTGVMQQDVIQAWEREKNLFYLSTNEGYLGDLDDITGDILRPGIIDAEANKEVQVRLPIQNILNLTPSMDLNELIAGWAVDIFTKTFDVGVSADL